MEQPILKNKHYEIEIIDLGAQGEGVGKIGEFTVFVPEAITGDVVEVRLIKVKKSYGYGKVMQIISPSPFRQDSKCAVAAKCGGCQIQHMKYQVQLDFKTKKVKDCIERIGGLKDIKVKDTLGMEVPYHYRNKAQYPIRKEEDSIQMGFFAQKSHRIVPSNKCSIQDPKNEQIMQIVTDFLNENHITIYNEETHKGLVRHLMIKTGYHTNEIMVCLVINGHKLSKADLLVAELRKVDGVSSILLNHQLAKTNVILGGETTLLYGKEYIIDKIGDLSFKISPLSFFQVNPLQTEVLYKKALEYAELTGEEIVWDAYCGIGTISLFLAQKAKKVYGVEIVPQAIENAKENAKLNGLTNVEFFTGKAEEIIPTLYKEEGIKADTIVVDPPRKGCDIYLLETLKDMAPQKIVYVSCDPATLARDLAYLVKEAGYTIGEVQPVDMFPHTTHVECCVSLKKN
ncbi:23S rRNA (uracil(1939)-C(5))-methyltransferase RlmD [Cellulosilyticum ruminicola]|uniref:23S rRNA (uracil(1939)-C(5))-methyltransferase RlmD n=1 Tax=Cellulosilyticum ruminicola TaxID=425254 RepID=UPI0006D2675E|nr:23S rRNA (uracil(1939)-C(5))-methyltransferase RlmD [Cellulosilyticum ruminicola]